MKVQKKHLKKAPQLTQEDEEKSLGMAKAVARKCTLEDREEQQKACKTVRRERNNWLYPTGNECDFELKKIQVQEPPS